MFPPTVMVEVRIKHIDLKSLPWTLWGKSSPSGLFSLTLSPKTRQEAVCSKARTPAGWSPGLRVLQSGGGSLWHKVPLLF